MERKNRDQSSSADLDYALNNDALKEPRQDAENYEALLKEYNYKKTLWEPSNRKCLMIIKSSITESIRGAIPDSNTAKEYLSKVEDQFKGSSKIYASTLIDYCNLLSWCTFYHRVSLYLYVK